MELIRRITHRSRDEEDIASLSRPVRSAYREPSDGEISDEKLELLLAARDRERGPHSESPIPYPLLTPSRVPRVVATAGAVLVLGAGAGGGMAVAGLKLPEPVNRGLEAIGVTLPNQASDPVRDAVPAEAAPPASGGEPAKPASGSGKPATGPAAPARGAGSTSRDDRGSERPAPAGAPPAQRPRPPAAPPAANKRPSPSGPPMTPPGLDPSWQPGSGAPAHAQPKGPQSGRAGPPGGRHGSPGRAPRAVPETPPGNGSTAPGQRANP